MTMTTMMTAIAITAVSAVAATAAANVAVATDIIAVGTTTVIGTMMMIIVVETVVPEEIPTGIRMIAATGFAAPHVFAAAKVVRQSGENPD